MLIRSKFEGYSRDGIRLYPCDDGGNQQSPASSQTSISELPDWARGYAKDALAKTAALTDTSQNPYKVYGADRIAGFSPLQTQSQQSAANMQTSGATGFGTQLAGAAGLGALGARYDPTQFQADQFGGESAQQYMSPYMQNVVDIQQREAQRQGDIAGTQLASQATKSGAFGGGRQAIMQAEAARNLATQKGDIQARGLQSSYEQAQNQFNADQARRMQAQQLSEQSKQYGAGYGMQGLQTALQGAGQLGTLGGQQFAQGMDINKLQNAYGGQQQALQQQGLTQAYKDFQNQQNYPYKQLGFMSDMIRGLPLGQQSTRQLYEAEPGGLQQLGALGAGAYGLSKFMAEGGMAYADGGSVDSPENLASIVKSLSPEQLKQALEAAQARGDIDQVEAIQTEMAMRASLSNGIAGAVTPQMADDMTTQYAAKGGILAFKERGVVDSDDDNNDGDDGKKDDVGAVNPSLLQQYYAANKALAAFKPTPAMTEAERAAFEQKEFDRRVKFAGEDPYAPMAEKFKQFEADRTKNYERGLGLAAFQAIPKILKGGSAARGLGEGIGAFGEGVSQLEKADAAEKRALASMDFNLKDAQRKERMGLTKEAMTSFTDAQKDKIAADKAKLEALKAVVRSTTDAGRAFRAPAAGKPGAGPKLAEINYANILANLKATSQPKEGESPEAFNTRLLREASELAVAQSKDFGPNKLDAQRDALTSKEMGAANEALIKHKIMNGREWKKEVEAAGSVEAATEKFRKNWITANPQPADNAAAKPSTVLNYDANGKRIN